MDFHVSPADGDLSDKASKNALTAFGVKTIQSPACGFTPPLDGLVASLLRSLLSRPLLCSTQTLS